MPRIKIAVAGCGDIAHIRYFYALQKLRDRYELIAVHDRDAAALAAASKEFSCPDTRSLTRCFRFRNWTRSSSRPTNPATRRSPSAACAKERT